MQETQVQNTGENMWKDVNSAESAAQCQTYNMSNWSSDYIGTDVILSTVTINKAVGKLLNPILYVNRTAQKCN